MSNLAVVIVSWNTRELLRRCIETVHASLRDAGIGYTIVVVDNASSDGTPELLRAAHPEVTLLEAGRNLGFAGGNNLALRHLLHPQPEPRALQHAALDYILLLNPDTEVLADALPQLVRFLEAHPQVAVVGPQLRYADGSLQPSRRRFPSRGVFVWESTPLEQLWPANPWARRYRCADTPADQLQPVDWLVGAALLVRRSAIERAGLLDAGFTMYSEELEWQRRIQGSGVGGQGSGVLADDGGTIMYLPDAVIMHYEGKSSEQALAQRYLNFQRSRLRDADMAYGARFVAALRWFLLAAYAAELAVELAKWLLGHKRALRAERAAVYWQVLRGLSSKQNPA